MANWWRLFGSKELDDLIDRALANNQDLRIASQKVFQAKARAIQGKAGQLPEVSLPAQFQAEIDRVNAKFARVEQIKKFFLLDTQLTAEDEELTPTMKLKRKLVEAKYAEQIEAMYR